MRKSSLGNYLPEMENERKSKAMTAVFTHLMQHSIMPTFTFPKGGIAVRTVASCLKTLETRYGKGISEERIVDFCICQVYTISRFDRNYLSRWNVTHSFGKKAIERFLSNKQANRYFEDNWLETIGISRNTLSASIKSRTQHPLFKYVNPIYEEATKRRALSTIIGYYICGASTLLWNPFSPACHACSKKQACKKRTQVYFPELYRLRIEEFNKKRDED